MVPSLSQSVPVCPRSGSPLSCASKETHVMWFPESCSRIAERVSGGVSMSPEPGWRVSIPSLASGVLALAGGGLSNIPRLSDMCFVFNQGFSRSALNTLHNYFSKGCLVLFTVISVITILYVQPLYNIVWLFKWPLKKYNHLERFLFDWAFWTMIQIVYFWGTALIIYIVITI